MRRIVCIYLPNWSIQRWRLKHPETRGLPLVVVEQDRRGRRIVAACSREALRRGIRPGQLAVEAEAAIEASARSGRGPAQALFLLRDATADLQALHNVAERCRELTPLVGCDADEFPDSLLLELTGYRDELLEPAPLAAALRAILDDGTLCGRIASAPGVHAAWALARFEPLQTAGAPHAGRAAPRRCGHRAQRAESERETGAVQRLAHPRWPLLFAGEWNSARPALLELPLGALRLEPAVEATLEELGLVTVGDVAALPRAELRRRFGRPLVHALQTLLGERPEAFPALPERPRFEHRLRWDFPVTDRGALQRRLDDAMSRLLQKLRTARMTTHRFLLQLDVEGQPGVELAIALATPTTDVERVRRVLALKLEELNLPAGVCGLHICAREPQPVRERTGSLFDELPGGDARSLESLADELVARLGPDAACRFVPAESHVPEEAFRPVALIDTRASDGAARLIGTGDEASGTDAIVDPDAWEPPLRPVVVHATPQPLVVLQRDTHGRPLRFRWNRRVCSVAAWSNEEAVQTAWWTPQAVDRRYFRIHTSDGRCLWIYQSGGEWFLHGEFA